MSVILIAFLLGVNAQNEHFVPKEPLVDMNTFYQEKGLDWRTLDCWQCAISNGKACHLKNYESMTSITGSRDVGDQVCCRPDFEGEYCITGGDVVCSQPYYNDDKDSSYANIVSSDFLNHQLFAFSSQTNQATCGLSSDVSKYEMSISAAAA